VPPTIADLSGDALWLPAAHRRACILTETGSDKRDRAGGRH